MTTRTQIVKRFVELYSKASGADNYVAKVKFDPSAYEDEMALKKAIKEFGRKVASALEKGGITEVPEETSDLMQYILDLKVEEELTDCRPPLSPGDVTFDQIAGLESVKTQLRINYIFPFKFPKLFPAIAKGILFYGPPGTGKCLSPEEKVLMFDGTMKMAKDIVEDDLLMGDDSTPRTVLSICCGWDEMYRIVPTKGEPFVVNSPHILSLVNTRKPRIHVSDKENRIRVRWMRGGREISKSFQPITPKNMKKAEKFMEELDISDDIVDIPLNEYLTKSKSWKTSYKGYRVGVDFPDQEVDLDPYILGAWLGDGSSYGAMITNIDEEILEDLAKSFGVMGLQMNPIPRDPISYRITKDTSKTNGLLDALHKYDLIKNKHIPHVYKANSREKRLQLLAGLLDTDGYLDNNCYEIIQKRKILAEDIAFVARSLGFQCTMREVTKVCTNSPRGRVEGIYYRCNISGEGLDDIPLRASRKLASPRKQIKNALHFGFEVESLGIGEYCGFTLDGNRRFLLKDFTVTHNTLMARAATAEIEGSAFFAPTPGELRGKYEGETEKNIDKVFQCAAAAVADPSAGYKFAIIFFDEFDSIGGKRGDDPGMSRSVNALLQQMDGIKKRANVSVVGATNYPDMLDDAILRRMGTRIFVDIPDGDAREYIVREGLATMYSRPGMTPEQKRKSIRNNKGEFLQGAEYMTNIERYGGFEGKARGWTGEYTTDKYVTDKYVTELRKIFGPTDVGFKIIEEVENGKDVSLDDPRLNVSTHIFGYSPSDISKIIESAIKFASFRSIEGYALRRKIPSWGDEVYYIHDPTITKAGKDALVIAEMTVDEGDRVLNFDIRQSDIDKAVKSLSSTIDNVKYLGLLKYARSA